MLTRTKALIAAGALVVALPAGTALADTGEVDDLPVTTVTCDGTQKQLHQADNSGPGGGDCINGESGEQVKQMHQKQLKLQSGECDGEGEQLGHGPGDGLGEGGYGPGGGDGPGEGPMNGQGQRNRASS
jgi:hypothetical protein